jgi:transcriptional regulator with XRE-family HTH domain
MEYTKVSNLITTRRNTHTKAGKVFMGLDTFGKRLRAIRQDRDLSQIQLRDRMERECRVAIGESYISELERTDKMPSLEVAAAMAKILDVSLDYLALLMDDGSISYNRSMPPIPYFSEEADEVAGLVDHMRPEQRGVVIQVARNLSYTSTDRQRRAAEMRDLLESVEREKGRDARNDLESILRSKGLLIGS